MILRPVKTVAGGNPDDWFDCVSETPTIPDFVNKTVPQKRCFFPFLRDLFVYLTTCIFGMP